MAKTIKFNLICDKKPVRTLEDLQNNFSIEDVLNYYNNKLLHRWLQVREYKEELDAVNKIKSVRPIDIIGDLIKIFSIEQDQTKVAEKIYMLEYLEEHHKLYEKYQQNEVMPQKIIDDYRIVCHIC